MPAWPHAGMGDFRPAKYRIPRTEVWTDFAARPRRAMVDRQPSQIKKKDTPMSKDGLCAIVTGSASGLGAATAAVLAKGGGRIVVNYSSSKDDAEATAEVCRKAGAAEVVVVQGDVARDEDCRKIVAAASGW